MALPPLLPRVRANLPVPAPAPAPSSARVVQGAPRRRGKGVEPPRLPAQLAAEVVKRPMLEFSRQLMKAYGTHTVLNRALTDFRDGLKPVHRRILWSAYNAGHHHNKPAVKSARIYGDVIGVYHPHGETAVYDAMETAARKIPLPLLDGTISNFGSITDGKAAGRYTETRLTPYADKVLLDSEYMNVVPMIPNYDGKDVEPLVLPALLPNLLFNGAEGIAVGVRTGIPPLHPEAIIRFMLQYWKTRRPITAEAMAEHVEFNWAIPCECLSTVADVQTWLGAGTGTLRFGPIYEYDAGKRLLQVTGVPMPFDWETISDKLMVPPTPPKKGGRKPFDFTKYVVSADDATSKQSPQKIFEIKFKPIVDDEPHVVDKAVALFRKSFPTNNSFTWRRGVRDEDIDFIFEPVPNLLMRWCDYRVELERRYQIYRYQTLLADFQKQKLMIFARQHIDAIIPIVKNSRDPKAELVARFKITPDQASSILELALRQLSRLSIDAIRQKMEGLRSDAAKAKVIHTTPVPTISAQITGPLAKLLTA